MSGKNNITNLSSARKHQATLSINLDNVIMIIGSCIKKWHLNISINRFHTTKKHITNFREHYVIY